MEWWMYAGIGYVTAIVTYLVCNHTIAVLNKRYDNESMRRMSETEGMANEARSS